MVSRGKRAVLTGQSRLSVELTSFRVFGPPWTTTSTLGTLPCS